jgi:catechol 2,3-dioxygenase-like lactoylglutathione lyase family enzyme
MATMNHTNLTTYNVPALTEFFCSVFGFQLVEKRADKLSVLRNAEGFVLTLMYDKRMTPEQGYPGMFHVGFLQPTQHAVDLVHDDLSIRNYMAPKPAKLQRGGPPTYGFYYDAPGGVTVEVSTMNIAERAEPHPQAGENLHSHPRRRIAECEPFGSVQEAHQCIHSDLGRVHGTRASVEPLGPLKILKMNSDRP